MVPDALESHYRAIIHKLSTYHDMSPLQRLDARRAIETVQAERQMAKPPKSRTRIAVAPTVRRPYLEGRIRFDD
jgi:hypothetical protein